MKLLIEIELKKEEGKAVDPEEVSEELCSEIENIGQLEVHGADNEDPTLYEITSVTLSKVTAKR